MNAVDQSNRSPFEQVLTVFDAPRYPRLAVKLATQYQAATPFPHVVIDDFLPVAVADFVASSYPDPRSQLDGWENHSNSNVSRRFIEDITVMPLAIRLLADAFNSRRMILFLETLSGIDCLLADPYFIGGGAMVSGNGDFLKVHADFNWHHKLQAHRRVNALLYLTPNWDPAWRGELELWSADMKKLEHVVQPLFNRLVVFSVSEDANHGQPQPLATPPSIYRRVFSAFYYTARRDDLVWSDPHFTQYKPENSPHGMALQAEYKAS